MRTTKAIFISLLLIVISTVTYANNINKIIVKNSTKNRQYFIINDGAVNGFYCDSGNTKEYIFPQKVVIISVKLSAKEIIKRRGTIDVTIKADGTPRVTVQPATDPYTWICQKSNDNLTCALLNMQ